MLKFFRCLIIVTITYNKIAVDGKVYRTNSVRGVTKADKSVFEVPGYKGNLIFFRSDSIKVMEPESSDSLACQEQGGELAIVDTRAKQALAVKIVNKHSGGYCSLRIGLTRKDFEFFWRDGTRLGNVNFWAPGEPKNYTYADCIYMTRCQGEAGLNRWHTKSCSSTTRIQICQWDENSVRPTKFSTRISFALYTIYPTRLPRSTTSEIPEFLPNYLTDEATNVTTFDIVKAINIRPPNMKLIARIGGGVILLIIIIAAVASWKARNNALSYKALANGSEAEDKDRESTTIRSSLGSATVDDLELEEGIINNQRLFES